MATKNIERSLVERGNATRNKFAQRVSKRSERQSVRRLLRQTKIDPEIIEDKVFPQRSYVWPESRLHFQHLIRWLLANCRGMNESEVLGAISRHFDTNTSIGRLVLENANWVIPKDRQGKTARVVLDSQAGLMPVTEWLERHGLTHVGQPGDALRRKKRRIQARQRYARELQAIEREVRAFERELNRASWDPEVRKLLELD